MYGVVLAGAPENRENLALSKTTGPFAWSQAGMLPSLAVPFSAYTVALIDLTLQTSVTLNRLAFDGYAGMVRHALAAITAMGSGARIADVRTKAASEVPERSSSIATEAPVAVLDIARKVADSAPAAALPASRRQRSRSPRSRASS
ncbi:hypothetical protein PUN4_180135 [Paraburkholderia unamae]|nr:hypothetical protein PUN4_180135 [Paraburkholderia unamae]